MIRQKISTASTWESKVGYSRAVRAGNLILVSGTTATDKNGTCLAIGDAGAQTRLILEKIASCLVELGASLEDVIRTRMFVTDITRWEEIGAVHGEFFKEIRPAATMVEISRLIDPDLLVEIEVEAILAESL